MQNKGCEAHGPNTDPAAYIWLQCRVPCCAYVHTRTHIRMHACTQNTVSPPAQPVRIKIVMALPPEQEGQEVLCVCACMRTCVHVCCMCACGIADMVHMVLHVCMWHRRHGTLRHGNRAHMVHV